MQTGSLKTIIAGAAIAIAGLTTTASAVPLPGLDFEIGMMGDTMNFDPIAQDMGQFFVNQKGTGGTWIMGEMNNPNWTVSSITTTFDTDPFISLAFAITNTSGSDANFIFSTSAFSSVTIISPTISGGTDIDLTDTSVNGVDAELKANTVTSDELYDAFFNATDVKSLIPAGDPGLPLIDVLATTPENIADSFGPETSSTDLLTGDTFGISHTFFLSAGDTATFNSTFFITPEPASLALFGLAGITLLRRRTR